MVEIPAHITGTVWKIQCTLGQVVAEGDVLIILESMKMEMPIEAPEAGVIERICCTEGQAVDEGEVVVVLGT